MDLDSMGPSWKKQLEAEFSKPYFTALTRFIDSEYAASRCYPAKELIFSALRQCPFGSVKVVIIGQDPYHGEGQACGLSFSVPDKVRNPPSLVNIFREIEQDLQRPLPENGNLERWAGQGVLLLNAILTVRASQAGSHANKGWEKFTDAIIERLSARREHLVFMLWGNYAQKKGSAIDASRHLVLRSGHPSPMSANQKKWFGNRHFSQANQYLENHGKPGIDW